MEPSYKAQLLGDGATASPRSANAQNEDIGIDKADILPCLEAYFEQNDSAGRVFLHKALVMTEFHQDCLDPVVLQALYAAGLRLTTSDADTTKADQIMNKVEAAILIGIGNITLSRLQALTILLHYRRMSAKRNELWMLLSLAARMALTLCLNHEHPALSTVRQECNRRLMWSLYMLDTLGCAGIDSLTVLPLSSIHIRLPTDDHSYAFGVPSLTARMDEDPLDSTLHSEDAMAKVLRLMPIRHQVLRSVS